MTPGPNLAALLATREVDKCFCGKPRAQHPKRSKPTATCGSQKCLGRWRRAYHKDYIGRSMPSMGVLRAVTLVNPHPTRKHWRVVTLECGHQQEISAGYVAKRLKKRRTCPECTAKRDNAVDKVLQGFTPY